MSAVCPRCGVAVVPGYVKCPKCQAVLPKTRRGPTHAGAGGTAVGGHGMPIFPLVVGGAVAIAIVLFFALRKGSVEAPPPQPTDPADELDPVAAPVVATPDPIAPDPTPGSAAPDPTAAVKLLDRALKKERLWSKVELRGGRVEIRTASCNDPTMEVVLETSGPPLKRAGLTRLRCMEQSGAVVFERDL